MSENLEKVLVKDDRLGCSLLISALFGSHPFGNLIRSIRTNPPALLPLSPCRFSALVGVHFDDLSKRVKPFMFVACAIFELVPQGRPLLARCMNDSHTVGVDLYLPSPFMPPLFALFLIEGFFNSGLPFRF